MADESILRASGNGPILRTLGWAAFLGASWTWCIGMFLPVLLVRDYGFWAFVVFAAPNVIGAAAMAWVLRDADASARVMSRHLPAVVAFSLVTVAFHLFFLFCVVMPLVGSWFILAIALLAVLVVLLLAQHLRGGWLIAAAVALAGSVVIFGALGLRGALAVPAQQGQLSSVALLWLLPVSIFGFALCPYLDITFHRARQATSPADGRLAFGVGFGVFFLAMILLTLFYAQLLITRRAGSASAIGIPEASMAVWLVAVHMAVQAGFTIAAHVRYAGRRLGEIGLEAGTVLILACIMLLVGALIVSARVTDYRGLAGSEMAYRLFMAFYGLVFPAYVWICMVPTRTSELTPARALLTYIGATIIAAPMFWMGFIERRMVWLLPGMAVVLLAGFVVRRIGPRSNQETLATVPRASDPAGATKNFLTASK
ncbi:MAG TPA: hypothetical protein VGR35_07785 [Tepidisphaeraceae bacterium]|nr:hypothetical protein [Tepidisphaeraceae bacterium]